MGMSGLPGNTTIVDLTEKDLPSILHIEQRCYQFPWSAGVMKDCLTGGYLCRGLLNSDGLIGYGILSVAVGECHVLNICVDPEFQGQGIAAIFLRLLLNDAKTWDAEIAFLEVRASNRAALSLYSKLGFSEIGCRKNYYRNGENREDALVLSLPLIELG